MFKKCIFLYLNGIVGQSRILIVEFTSKHTYPPASRWLDFLRLLSCTFVSDTRLRGGGQLNGQRRTWFGLLSLISVLPLSITLSPSGRITSELNLGFETFLEDYMKLFLSYANNFPPQPQASFPFLRRLRSSVGILLSILNPFYPTGLTA